MTISRWKRSRLARKEEIRSLRRAYILAGSTIILILAVVFLGIPLLVKFASFLGEIKNTSQVIESEDKTPPPPPNLFSLPKTVKESEIKIQGTSEINSKVIIFVNGQSVKDVVVDQEGKFTAVINLTSDKNEITLLAEDQAGNKSEETEKKTIVLDKQPPDLLITFPKDEVASMEEAQISIQGTTENEAKVLINDHLVILDQNGNFIYPILLSEGENIIKIVAQDEAGNETQKEIKINYNP